MDFHSIKRKDLQRLCKKHGIQANLKNVEMIDRLSSLFKEENPSKRGSSCLKSGEEEVVSSNESKRVKFSLENETFWFEKTDPREMRLMARKKRSFQDSKIEQNPVSIVEEVVQNDGNLGKTLERKSRRRSVLVKCDQISESKSVDVHVEKPVTLERKVRKGSVAVKCNQSSESKSVDDDVGKPVQRSLRRKSLAVKSDEILEPKAVDDDYDFEKPVSRNMRRKSVVVEPDHISELRMNDEKVEKPVQRTRRKSVVVESDHIFVSKMNDEKIAKPVQRTRRKAVVVEADQISESKLNDEKVEKPVQRTRRKSVLVEADHISESKMNYEKVENPVQRKRRKSIVVEAGHISESKMNDEKVEEPAQRTRGKSVAVKSGPNLDLETVVDKIEKPVQRASRRKSIVVKSDHILDSKHVVAKIEKPATRASMRKSVAVKSDQILDSKTDEVERDSRRSFVESDENVNSNIAVENDIQEKSSDIAPDIKKGKRGRTMKITRKQGVKRGRKAVAEDLMEENVGDETIIIDKTHDDAVADVQTLSDVSSMLQNCCDGKAESSTQANKVESLSLNIVANKNSYEEDAPTPPSLLRTQFSDTLVGSTTIVAGEHMCQSTTRPSLLGSCAVGDAGGEQPSGSLSEIKSARRDRETFESSDGIECHQSRNEQWSVQQESFEKSPSLVSSPKNEIAVEDERIDRAVGIIEESNVKTTEQDERNQLFGSCESIVGEVGQTCEVSVDHQPSHFTPGEKVVLSPEADMETKVQTPVVEGVILSPNALDSTQNKAMEEGKDISTSTQLWNQDLYSRSSDAEDSPVVLSLNKDDDVVDSLKSKASECVSVSGKTKYLKHSVDAAEDMKCNVTCSNSNANVGNFGDQGTPGVSHPVNRLLHLDAFNAHFEPPKHNDPPEENITAADKLDNCVKDDDNFAELKLIPQEDIIHQLETLSDNNCAQSCELTVVSDSVAEGRHKGTPSTDFTCFSNDENGKCINENAKYITAKQPEEANCVDELEFQHMFSVDDEDDITNDAQSKDLEFKRVTWTPEDLLALGEVEESVMSQERKPADVESERNTLHLTKDFELKTVKDDDAAKNDGEDSVIILQVQYGELAETSNVENATSNGGCRSSCNAVSENSLIKETVYPVCEFGVHCKGDETSADLKSNSCNIHVELMDFQTPKVLNAENSSPDASQEKTNLKIEIDHIAAQETKFVDSFEDKVKSRAQETGYVEEAEVVGTCGDGNPGSTIGDMLDEAPVQGFSQQAKSVGSVKKDSAYISQQARYVEGTIEVLSSADNESYKSNSEREVDEELEMEFSVHNNMLATVSKSSKRDAGDEIVEECSIVATGLGHCVEHGKHFGSFRSPLEMADKIGSPMRNSGNFSLRKVDSGSDNDAGSLMVDYPTSMDTRSTCCSADVYAPTCKIASESLQTSQVYICNETLLNACIGDVDGLHSGEPIPFEDNQENIAEIVESEARASNATLSESAVLDSISVALVSEIHDGPGCIVEQDSFEYANTREMELHGLTCSPFFAVNRKVKGNCEANIAEQRDNICSDMVESHSFGESEKEASDIEGALKYVPEEQIGNHLNAASRTKQENVSKEQDACTNVNDHLATSLPEDLLRCDIGEVSHVETNIVHEKVHSESELVFTANHGNCMSEDQVNNQEHMEFIHRDASVIEKEHSAMNCCGSLEMSPKHVAHGETRSPASNDYSKELDFSKSPDVGLSQDNRDVSAVSISMEEDGTLAEEHFSGPSERRIGRESSDIDTSDNIADTEISPPSICQPGKFITALLANEGLKSSAVFTDSELDYLFCGDWETEKVEVRELQSDSSNVACSVNEYEIPDVEYDTVGTHQPSNEMILEPENLASGDQELGNRESEARGYCEVFESSVTQRKNIKNNAEFQDLKSDIIFTDSEIDLLWGETAKDEVRELQTEASDDTCLVAVSEYGSADVETDMVNTHQPAVEKILEPQNFASEDHNPLGDDEKGKSDVSVDPVRDVQNCIDDKVIQRKNERSILIHGTPKKLSIFMNDMKENTPAPKRQQMVDVTAVKPSLRRKALQKID